MDSPFRTHKESLFFFMSSNIENIRVVLLLLALVIPFSLPFEPVFVHIVHSVRKEVDSLKR